MSDGDLRRGVRAILSGAAVVLDVDTLHMLEEAIMIARLGAEEREDAIFLDAYRGRLPVWVKPHAVWHLVEVIESHGDANQSVFACGHRQVVFASWLMRWNKKTGGRLCKRCKRVATRKGIGLTVKHLMI